MGNNLIDGVIIFGENLFTTDWDEICTEKPERFQISALSEPIIPKMNWTKGTAYVDLTDQKFLNPSFLRQLTKSFDKLRVIGITDSATEYETIEIAKMGISEVLTLGEYKSRVSSYLEKKKEKPAPKAPKSNNSQYDLTALIGNSPKMLKIKKIIDQLRDVDFPNAIFFGGTGTGKDLLAKVMHYTGIRKDFNFIDVNCSAIPDELFESELFGHCQGAFTGAKSDKMGLFEYAENGTIFLDEIGNLSISAQAKLLKILENRRLRPLGAVEDKDLNVRVLAATNKNLDDEVKAGNFREDLLFRLNLISIYLPPLSERLEDIPDLAKQNFDFYSALYNKPNLSVSDEAMKCLQDYNWPGNIRELRNVIERTVLLASANDISAKQLSEAISNGRISIMDRRQIIIDVPKQGISLKDIEKQVVGEILNLAGWNRSEAARILGISRARLRRIMEDNNLHDKRRKNKSLEAK